MQRTILHLDMDAFFAAVEQRDFPQLRNKPLLVGYDGPRGVVATASYEARVFGCRSAQPIAVAKRLCPHALIVPGRHSEYRKISHQVFAILDEFSPVVEPLSIDEAFVDLTGTEKLLGDPRLVGQKLKQRVLQETALTASVGIAPNKFLAKLASDLEKPDGLVLIQPADIDRILPPLPVTKLWGVGPAMASRLKLLGISTIEHLRKFPLDTLRQQIGDDEANHYHRLALGLDDRPVELDQQAKSIGQEQTFETDIGDPAEIRRILLEQVDHVGRRLRKHRLHARTLTLKIRYGDFHTVTRSKTLPHSTDATADLEEIALAIWDHWVQKSFQPLRLIGVTSSQLGEPETQLGLFADPQHEKRRQLDKVADQISERFGKSAIRRGGTMK